MINDPNERIAAALERMAPRPRWKRRTSPSRRRLRLACLSPTGLEPVDKVNRVEIDLLVGIDRSRDTLLENTRQFARGFASEQRAALGLAWHGQVVASSRPRMPPFWPRG